MSQSTVNECFLFLLQSLETLIPSCPNSWLNDYVLLWFISLIYSMIPLHQASSHNSLCQLLSHLFSKSGVMIRMICTTIDVSQIYASLLKYWKPCLIPSFFLHQLTLSLIHFLVSISSCSQQWSSSSNSCQWSVPSPNKRKIHVLSLLEFSSAFETIDRSILAHRLYTEIGYTETVLQWFSY